MGFGLFVYMLTLSVFSKPLVIFSISYESSLVLKFLQNMSLNAFENNETTPVSLCSWRGISCDTNGHIVKLELSDRGLSGRIPRATIGELIKLDTLDLSNNNITYLPDDIWGVVSLRHLNLSCNQISGIIPNNISNVAHLQILDLSRNYFHGGIPEAMGSLTRLEFLSLSNNRLDSMIPLGIFGCRSLMHIDLSSNNISGYLQNGFGSAFSELKFLNLADNRIVGQASDLIGLRTAIYLNVSSNSFRGSVVGVFEGLMEVIDLSRNHLQGLMAQVELGSTFNWSKLVYLDISENQFSGEFSTRLRLALNLKHLNLAHNRFSEQQFLRVDKLLSLEYLNLSATNMVGPISSNISHLGNLSLLDLSHNLLTNGIPPILTNNLRVLDVSYNNLTGNIPYNLLQQLHNMDKFNFSINNLNYCAPQLPGQASFIGLPKSCPIAADSIFFPRKAPKHKGLNTAFVLTLSLSCFLVGLLLLAFGCRYNSAMWASKTNPPTEEQTLPSSFPTETVSQHTSVPVVIFHKPLLKFTFADLLVATSNFDQAMLLSEGKFGSVYSGLLPGDLHVAVKVLAPGSTMTNQEAVRELEYLSQIKHQNIVPLMGFCVAGEQRIAIYEYMENGNLQNLLHDLPLGIQTTEECRDGITSVGPGGPFTNWSFRHSIALGVARALAFLHHGCSPPIIHRDVKASSVYLDSNLEPRLSDFGLARIFGNGVEDAMARESSAGYASPEFYEAGNGSPEAPTPKKSDVCGFGVVLLELVTGKKAVEDDYPDTEEGDLVSWVRCLVRMSQGSRAIDPRIRNTGPEENMVEALKIGYLCTAEIPYKRPCMHSVVGLLKDIE